MLEALDQPFQSPIAKKTITKGAVPMWNERLRFFFRATSGSKFADISMKSLYRECFRNFRRELISEFYSPEGDRKIRASPNPLNGFWWHRLRRVRRHISPKVVRICKAQSIKRQPLESPRMAFYARKRDIGASGRSRITGKCLVQNDSLEHE